MASVSSTSTGPRVAALSIGGDLPVFRLGYGAIHLTGPLRGDPRDRDARPRVA
jgi:hypothetical protein